MDIQSFLEKIVEDGTNIAMVKYYKLGPDVPHSEWRLAVLYLQRNHKDQFTLLALKDNPGWAEYSIPHDIESFEGDHMILVNEEYALEIKL